MASAFLGKNASITAVDLIQQKKLDFQTYYECNLMEARLEIVNLYRSIRIMTVNTEFTLHEFKVSYAMCASDTLECLQQVNAQDSGFIT